MEWSGSSKRSATRVSARLSVLVDSTRASERRSGSIPPMPARCLPLRRHRSTIAGIRDRAAQSSHCSSTRIAGRP